MRRPPSGGRFDCFTVELVVVAENGRRVALGAAATDLPLRAPARPPSAYCGAQRRRFGLVELVRDEAAGLVAPELLVVAAATQQLGMRAFLDDRAGLEHDEPI